MARASGRLGGALVGAALLVLPASAQEPPAAGATNPAPAAAVAPAETPTSPPEGRVLGGHVFMPSPIVAGPFVTTSFTTQMILLAGSTDASVTIGDQVVSGSLDFAGLGAFAGYEHAFGRHFSARVWLDDFLYSGITGAAVAIVGSQVQVGVGAGATASLPIGNNLRLGVLLDASSVPSIALTITEALRDIVDACEAGDCNLDTTSAVEVENLVTVEPAVAVAWAPLEALGVTGNLAYVHLDGNGSTGTAEAMRLGAALDLDLLPLVRFPLGLQAQVSWLSPMGDDAGIDEATDVGFGIHYTGRRNVALGVQLLGRRFSVQPGIADTSWSAFLTRISLRYYW
jgi:hypothetical protein